MGLLDSLLWFAPRLTVLSFVTGSKEKSLKVCTCPSCEITPAGTDVEEMLKNHKINLFQHSTISFFFILKR